MAHRHHGQAEHEEQTLSGVGEDYDWDPSRFCRKPRLANKPRDVYIVADTSSAMAQGEGKIQLARMALRALYNALSPEERIEISTSGEHGERIQRRMEKGELQEIELERILDGLGAKGESHIFDNMLQRLADLDDMTNREVTVVALAAALDEDGEPEAIIEELRREILRRPKLRFVILGIGLGADIAAQLAALCEAHRNADFEPLTNRPAAQVDKLFSAQAAAKHALEIEVVKPERPAVIGGPVEFCVLIRNESDHPVPAGSRLYMNPNNYFRSSFVELPEVPADGGRLSVLLRAMPKGRVSVQDLEERCEVNILDRNRDVIITQPFFLDMVDFLGELANKRHPTDGRCLNIYVIGAQGAGKGSFINTILTLLSEGDSVVTEGADVGGGADHQTTQLESFNIKTMMRSTRLPRFPFRIFDTWGMEPKNYRGIELENMLKGLLPVGFSMDANPDDLLDDRDRIIATAHQREAHAVFFFVSFGVLGDDEQSNCLAQHFRTVKRLGFNPMVVLAQADFCEPTIRDDPLNWKLPNIATARTQLAKLLNVGVANVLVSVPYATRDSLERDFQIEKLAYHNLKCALDAASQYLLAKEAGSRRGIRFEEEDEDDEDEYHSHGVGGRPGGEPVMVGREVGDSDTASQCSVGSSVSNVTPRGRHQPYTGRTYGHEPYGYGQPHHRMAPQAYSRSHQYARQPPYGPLGSVRHGSSASSIGSSVTHGSMRNGPLPRPVGSHAIPPPAPHHEREDMQSGQPRCRTGTAEDAVSPLPARDARNEAAGDSTAIRRPSQEEEDAFSARYFGAP